jgi:Spy/CpxP family protein refolding chaperone
MKNFIKIIFSVLLLNFIFISCSNADTTTLSKILGLDSQYYQSKEQIQKQLVDLDNKLKLTEEQSSTASQFGEICKTRLLKYKKQNLNDKLGYIKLKTANESQTKLTAQLTKIRANQTEAIQIRNKNISAFKTILTAEQNVILDSFLENMNQYSSYKNLLEK